MTVRTSVLWKMNIHMAKKWPEMVVQRSYIKGHSFPYRLYVEFGFLPTLWLCFLRYTFFPWTKNSDHAAPDEKPKELTILAYQGMNSKTALAIILSTLPAPDSAWNALLIPNKISCKLQNCRLSIKELWYFHSCKVLWSRVYQPLDLLRFWISPSFLFLANVQRCTLLYKTLHSWFQHIIFIFEL